MNDEYDTTLSAIRILARFRFEACSPTRLPYSIACNTTEELEKTRKLEAQLMEAFICEKMFGDRRSPDMSSRDLIAQLSASYEKLGVGDNIRRFFITRMDEYISARVYESVHKTGGKSL